MYIVLEHERLCQRTLVALRCIVDYQHRQVIALLGFANKRMHAGGYGFEQLLGLKLAVGRKRLLYTFQTIQLVLDVLRLCQSVSIEEQSGVRLQLRFLNTILHVVEQADRDVRQGIDIRQFPILQDDWRIVASIAIAQTTSWQVEHTDKEGDENTGVVALAGDLIDGLHDMGGIVLMSREGTEQRMDHAHHHRRWCSLATDIANAEEQLLISDVKIIQVTTHLTGWHQRTIDIHIVVLQMAGRQHALLYLAGHAQLAANTFLFGICLAQPF